MVKQRERDEIELEEENVAGDSDSAVARVLASVKPEAEEPLGETPDSVELYLNEIARYKLLRPDEEVTLAKEIENGRILDELADAYMEQHGTPPTQEQLIVCLLQDVLEGLSLVRR